MEAIILAGGLGTRLRSAVPDVPKPMAPIRGRPFLEYLMTYWVSQGITRFVLSVGYRRQTIEEHFGQRYGAAEIDYAVEATPLGTGGGLIIAMSKMRSQGPWLVLNGDTFFEVNRNELAQFHDERGADATLALHPVDDNRRYTGVELAADQRITQLTSAAGGRRLVNGGVYLLGAALLAGLPYRAGDRVSLETEILENALLRHKRLYGMVSPGAFIDIGVPDDYARAAELLT
jgi:D-glycero-alpha-D-manno-heptose 1-phosphate guanylyltransferase